MAKAKLEKKEASDPEAQTVVGCLQRIESLLALLLIKGVDEIESIRILAGVGYSPSEIAKLVDKTPNAVRIILHRARKAG